MAEPYKPIAVNEYGERLIWTGVSGSLFDCCQHDRCGGIIHRIDVSDGYDVVSCQKCGLRLHIAKSITTHPMLRGIFARFNEPENRLREGSVSD